MERFLDAPRSLSNASTATGSVADRMEPNVKHSTCRQMIE
jgi:hypothetical protein